MMALSHSSNGAWPALISLIACLDSSRRRSLKAARLACLSGDAHSATLHATTADQCLADMADLRRCLNTAS